MTSFNESKLSKILSRALIAPEDRSQFLPLSTVVYCPSNNGVRASRLTVIKPTPIVTADTVQKIVTGTEPSDTTTTSTTRFTIGASQKVVENYSDDELTSVQKTLTPSENKVDITLDKPLTLTYTIPYDVDLETDFDLQNLIKSDMAVRFKKAVSKTIHSILVAKSADITKLTTGATLADTLGLIIADNICKGTGQRFSVYRYNNGAPVPYIQSSPQPNITNQIEPGSEFSSFASVDDAGIGALHYISNPSVILPYTSFQEYQQGLCDGTIKTYVESKLNVDTTMEDFASLGEGVVGSNDCFAVAFTEPHIVETKAKNMFAKELNIAIFYGVELISDSNLRVLE